MPADASCAWSFDNGQGPPQTLNVGCGEEVNMRALYRRATKVTVDVRELFYYPDRAEEIDERMNAARRHAVIDGAARSSTAISQAQIAPQG